MERVPTARYEYALEMMGDVPYGMWREFDPEGSNSIRFYALRMRDLGMIKSTLRRS